ncbi:hypothetical protein DL764_009202 [Monosporascus ibericus]|uniref:Uncharacterized protein n=1 Tax=Monosporascus ibericus TaxID=155417 RepID=A0A4Q4SYI4_9PEZI|nr:hypothetical protein DL764_009202 [Monosporascus ibericus]
MDDLPHLHSSTPCQPRAGEGRSAHKPLSTDLLSDRSSREGLALGAYSALEPAAVNPTSPATAAGSQPNNRLAPLSFPADCIPLSWALQNHKRAMSTHHSSRRRSVVANLIVTGIEGPLVDILEAIHKELARTAECSTIALRGNPPKAFVHIETNSERSSLALVERARNLTDELLSDKSATASILFQEPLGVQPNARVILDIQGSGAKPRLDHPLGRVQKSDESGAFMKEVSRAMYQGLKKVAQQGSDLILRRTEPLHLIFRTLMFARVADTGLSRRILAMIQQSDGPLLPTDNQTPSAADVVPEHMFEAHWAQGRLQADIVTMHDVQNPAKGSPRYMMNRVRTFRGKPTLSKFNLTTLSIGRKFDWNMEASRDEEMDKTITGADQYFASATIRMKRRGSETHPDITLNAKHELAKVFRNVTTKSVYRFRWRTTPYIVEIAINRRWESISAMRQLPKVDFGIAMYGEYWDRRSQGVAQAAGNAWGDELNPLFGNEDGSAEDAEGRVCRFVTVVQEVQDILEKA